MPVFLVIALMVKISNPGPVFFRQRRIGYRGEGFYILKFRSMRSEHVPSMEPVRGEHPHLTKFGKFLRDSSLDELPQFINVIRGDMSLVGPRPLADYHAEHYAKNLPIYHERLKMQPGITGLVQVSDIRNKSHTLQEARAQFELDASYIRNWSLMGDLCICAQTLKLLLLRYHQVKQGYSSQASARDIQN
jgi:putative colanic acid biosynthesis UDP-glucose lipid carrier transferase